MVGCYTPCIKVTCASELYWIDVPDVTNCYVEYKKNIKELEKIPTTNPWTLLRQKPFNLSGVFTSILYELPLVSLFFFGTVFQFP